MAKKIEINENWEPVEVEDLDSLFIVLLKHGSFDQGYVEAFDTDDALMQSAYDDLARQYGDCGCDEQTRIYLIKVPNTDQTANMCKTGLFNGSSCDPHVIEATRDLFNRADCEQVSCWEGCGLTEGKKKKKPYSSAYCGFTDPALNIKHFNKCMGTAGLGEPYEHTLIVGDVLPNEPVAAAPTADSGATDGAGDAGASGGEGGGMGESLAESYRKAENYINSFDCPDDISDEFYAAKTVDEMAKVLTKFLKIMHAERTFYSYLKGNETMDGFAKYMLNNRLEVDKTLGESLEFDPAFNQKLENEYHARLDKYAKNFGYDSGADLEAALENDSMLRQNVIEYDDGDNFLDLYLNWWPECDAFEAEDEYYGEPLDTVLQDILDNPIARVSESVDCDTNNGLCSIKKETWVQQEDGQLKNATEASRPDDDLSESKEQPEEQLTEARLDWYEQKDKMFKFNNLLNRRQPSRNFNAKAASDEKLKFNARVCKSEGYTDALKVIEDEMMQRGLISAPSTQPASQPAAQPAAQPAKAAIKFTEADFSASLLNVVAAANDAQALIQQIAVTFVAPGADPAADYLMALIFAVCLKKDAAFIGTLKEHIVNKLNYPENLIKESLKACVSDKDTIDRITHMIGRIVPKTESLSENQIEKGIEESVGLDEAKRYVKRYYVRPQNIFCSNKEDILKALLRVNGENCSIYSLKNLADHDNVQELKPSDIIYYYDDGILYDKNHVKVMDYDLNVKHEEERKKFANVDAAPDAQVSKEYDDRLTDADLKDKEAVANFRAINARQMK